MKTERLSGLRAWSTVTVFSLLALQTVQAAVKERLYTFDDAGAVAGQLPPLITAFNRRGTEDTAPSTTDYGGVDDPTPDDGIEDRVNNSFVPLIGSGNTARVPIYADASDRPGALAGNLGMEFDGVDDTLYNPLPPSLATTPYLFDPRDFGQFDALSQAWVKPTTATFGTPQFVWRVGGENGGLVITADGKWALRTGNPSAEVPIEDVEVASNVSVALNEWTHLAVFRGGNFSFLYVNGSVAAMDPGFWGQDGPDVRLGADSVAAGSFFKGIVDDFSIGTLSDGVFDLAVDLDYFDDVGQMFSNVDGDVDQDGVVDQADYDIWSVNVGFDNGFGVGGPSTLLLGDVNQSGRVDLVDFQIINQAALNPPPPAAGAGGGVPEASSFALFVAGLVLIGLRRARGHQINLAHGWLIAIVAAAVTLGGSGTATAAVVVADDFLYDGPSKLLHVGGGFNGFQQYLGGQNGPAGNWARRLDQIGDGIITTPDYTPPIDPFNGLPEPVAPAHVALYDGFFNVQSELFRDFALAGSVSPTQTLYFGGRFRADLEIGTDGGTVPQFYAPRLFLNRVAGDDRLVDINGLPVDPQRDRTQDIALGIEENMVVARLGADVDGNGFEVKTAVATNPPDDGNWHLLIGKLELNVSGGTSERLSVWIDPSGMESGGTTAVVEADVLPDLTTLIGTFHSQGTVPLDPVDPETGRSYIDDMAIGTAWQDVANVSVPRLTLRINRTDGSGRLINNTSSAFQLNGYSVESASGALNGTGWNSLDEQNVGNWQQNLATDNQLVETAFMGSTGVAPGGQLSLGNLFDTGASEDVIARYSTQDGLLNLIDVEFVSGVGVPGDYNGDGRVSAADYTVWRDTLGTNVAMGSGADGNNNGTIDQGDYNVWKSNFGMPPGSGSGLGASTVPEPSGFALWLIAALAEVVLVRREAK